MFQNVLGTSSPAFLIIILSCYSSVCVGIGNISVFEVYGSQKLQSEESRKTLHELGQQKKHEPPNCSI